MTDHSECSWRGSHVSALLCAGGTQCAVADSPYHFFPIRTIIVIEMGSAPWVNSTLKCVHFHAATTVMHIIWNTCVKYCTEYASVAGRRASLVILKNNFVNCHRGRNRLHLKEKNSSALLCSD